MALRIAAPQRGTASVIILHGLGDSGAGWEFLAREFHRKSSLKHINFVLPSAPMRPMSAFQGERVPAWFDVNHLQTPSLAQITSDTAGIAKTLEFVKKLINDEVEQGIAPNRIIVGGFSQGGALTMSLAVTISEKLAGFLSMSGFLPVADYLDSLKSSANQATPFLLTHGTADPVVPLKAGVKSQELLRERFGLKNTTFATFNGMEHSINLECMSRIAQFFETNLP